MDDTLSLACNNCNRARHPVEEVDDLTVVHNNLLMVYLCNVCLKDTKSIKIVLKRNAAGNFEYEQYTAIEMQVSLSRR